MANALIETPNSSSDPSDLVTEEIFVPDIPPPGETPAAAPTSASAMAPAQSGTQEPAPIAELDFLSNEHRKIVPLRFPFRYQGKEVCEIAVRRLRIGDVDRFIQRARQGGFSTFDVYAEMAGYPAAILRGLIDEDGDAIVDACFDFLPQALRPAPAPSAT